MEITPDMIQKAKAVMNSIQNANQLTETLFGKGVTPEQAVRTICKQRGIDVGEFMKQLK